MKTFPAKRKARAGPVLEAFKTWFLKRSEEVYFTVREVNFLSQYGKKL